ncbi:hypothetical protein Cgig2_004930 [Carnegiea gigantea]|uniref:AAA+ ATPase domain-containing protein n=1 Tax=Carnegiea gigantea TaxID=171969 RepID=A0A9Q1QSK9_9CARY|nr:hypothetical protein Cgig2_004930 [Carnegiea gigantea]
MTMLFTLAEVHVVAIKCVQPSLKREGFSEVPDVTWEDIGGLDNFVDIISLAADLSFYVVFQKLKETFPRGFLLFGPPGCGKTLIAKAVANEAGASFVYHKLDALRSEEYGWVVHRVIKQLDGAEQRQGVYVISAANRPDLLDNALLRPRRFEKRYYVPLPSPDERGLILKAHARKMPVDASVDLLATAKSEACEHFSGADLDVLMRLANDIAYKEMKALKGIGADATQWTICAGHFEKG